MAFRSGARRLVILALALLTSCAGHAPRMSPQLQAQVERDAADGRFDSLWEAAQTAERFNDPQAVTWYERAVASSPWTHRNPQAEEALGRIWSDGVLRHDDGPNIVQAPALRASWRKGERWYLASVNHGNPMAVMELAKRYRQRGDAAAALRWDLRAAVYQRYFSASATPPDSLMPSKGRPHPLVADIEVRAQRGDAEAQVDLGALYEMGAGRERDTAAALRWYRLAGEQGNVFGQYFSGLLLGRGKPGVSKDEEAAAAWFARAAVQNFYLAQPAYWKEAIKPPFATFP